jgi:putative pyoverdin transport system ATP-binding/permease protein
VLLQFFARDSSVGLRALATIAALAGLSNAAILTILNTAAEQTRQGATAYWYLALFATALALYNVTQRHAMRTSTVEVERLIDLHRRRISEMIRRCDLATVEHLGRARIYAAVTSETMVISQNAGLLVMASQAVVLIVFTLVYLASLTVAGLVLTLVIAGLAVYAYLRRAAETEQDYLEASRHERLLFDRLTDLLDGFKEVQLNRARSVDLGADIAASSGSVTQLKTRADSHFASAFVFTQSSFYLLAAAMVFLLPGFNQAYPEVLLKTTTVVLFLIGPISTVVGSANAFAATNQACRNIDRLEDELSLRSASAPTAAPRDLQAFQRIDVRGVQFHHLDPSGQPAFRIGPLDLAIARGELIFISGGNGSGKSSLLKVLTALYRPASGTISFDGVVVDDGNIAAYQSLFSVVFSDFHLFQRLYGLHDVAPERLAALIEQMGLTNKTRLIDGGFDTIDLSTGQKRRLALVVSLLEERPICIFDEVAADQDPEFRHRYYEEILPQLKRAGKTVIAVTHDDRYFDRCDRRLVMEAGQIVHTVGAGVHS